MRPPKIVEAIRESLRSREERRLVNIGLTAASLVLTLTAVGLIIFAFGASPWAAFWGMLDGSLGSMATLGETLMISVPLGLTALAAAIPFTARLWNVGGEGQMHVGAIAAVGLALSLPNLPAPVLITIVVFGSLAAGGIWGLVAGVLKVTLGANEVITTLMMNFIGVLLATFAITTLWPQVVGNQTREVPPSAWLPELWSGTPVDSALPIAALVVLAAWLLMRRSGLGLAMQACGFNPRASRLNGYPVRRIQALSILLGAACAGLAGGMEVIGRNHALIYGFSANYGYLGIAVALVARLDPKWIPLSAFGFAMLLVGSQRLPATTDLPTAVGQVLIAVCVVSLLATRVIGLKYSGQRV